jgi:hypothetical protein
MRVVNRQLAPPEYGQFSRSRERSHNVQAAGGESGCCGSRRNNRCNLHDQCPEFRHSNSRVLRMMPGNVLLDAADFGHQFLELRFVELVIFSP